MLNYHLVSDYRNNKIYRESFFELAKSVFDIDFTKWYEKGCWNDNYICYSYVDNDRIIANASISKMTIVLKGKEYKAIQIGTVMTHPDYRNQGLSKKLMNYIIEQYEKEYDFIYLFANDTVLDFYPKFGFQRVKESHFILNMSALRRQKIKMSTLRQLDINNQYDFNLLESFAAERIPVSSVLGVKNNEHLLMFYFILVFSDAIFYIEEEDTIVICKQEGTHLHVFDLISKKRVNIEMILSGIVSRNTETVHLYFTPEDDTNVQTEFIKDGEDTLFIRPMLKDTAKHFLFPITSHA
ncbi:GNAT family N-acetyltransferase [uncultured Rummeliibacillus sp.]|uniref:GNAT family N-acetyltransferase n=1 Tax=uncultured Rummeliibacillus sp. TaxID=762292 RepID=UPI002604BE52|nr:GNAT family N-acetyltransferase [uncultured Rummeliibacillus sp.]